ncbi:MAG TPA: ATP-binding protein [Candidatus Polarisedimenticolia bacterium]|jgi:signal transduction histidine kinase|nr:ATP-binding protein [Candidatus Polarisedimenticolia bacterium]
MRLGLRARITALLLLLSVAPPCAVVWIIRERVLPLVRAEDEGRIADALSEFEAAIEREGRDAAGALEIVALLLESDPRFRAGVPGADSTASLMADAGLDCLSILDARGTVLASGHAPASAGRSERLKLDLPDTRSTFVEEEIAPGIGRVLTLQSRRVARTPRQELHLVGGRFLDADFLRRLSPGGTVRTLLLDGDGAILAASDPDNPPPIPAGWKDPQAEGGRLDIRGVPHSYRMIRLRDHLGRPVGALVAAVSLARGLALSSSLGAIALWVVAAGLLASLLLGFVLARGVTGPLRRLEEMSRRIAADRYEPVAGPPGPGEIGALVSAFNHMARGLAESRERLRQTERLAAAEEVARRVAHEIKNPLSPIALTLEGLVRTRQTRPQEFDAAFEAAARTIQEEIQRIRGILEDFSRFGRLPVPRPRPSDLNGVVSQAVTLYSGSSPGARIVADLDPAMPSVSLDPDRMSEVINNLVGNALQALEGRDGTITVTTRRTDAGAEIRVSDTGPGLPQEVLGRLFEPYVSTTQGGTGLGMAIARRIVLDHGGRIEAGNRPGLGAEIRILLPWGAPRGAAGGHPTGS